MSTENFKIQIRKGLLEFCVLQIISKKEVYASEIIEELKNSKIIVVEGTVYPLLSRLKKSDYITNVKKKVDSSWTYGKDEINFNDYSERIIKAEEERTKSYIANLKVALEKEFKNFSNNKSTLSKSDFISVVTKIEESNFDREDVNKDGVITEEEHKAFLAKQKKTQATTPAPKK